MPEHLIAISTADGPMDLFAAWPDRTGVVPGVIVHMDAFGLREELFDIARSIAQEGYAAFVPDLYHRFTPSRFQPASRAGEEIDPGAARANDATTLPQGVANTAALLRHVDGEGPVRVGRIGTVGYCMGGRYALAAAAAFADRIAAVASIHGGRLVTSTERSPHLLLHAYRSEVYLAFAADDPTCPPEHQRVVAEALRSGRAIGRIRRFSAHHGWSFPTRWCYDREVHRDVLELFGRDLVLPA